MIEVLNSRQESKLIMSVTEFILRCKKGEKGIFVGSNFIAMHNDVLKANYIKKEIIKNIIIEELGNCGESQLIEHLFRRLGI